MSGTLYILTERWQISKLKAWPMSQDVNADSIFLGTVRYKQAIYVLTLRKS